MNLTGVVHASLLLLTLVAFDSSIEAAESFRVATYNLENYVLTPAGSRESKSESSKARIRESILALKPDVLALQEIGGRAALEELRKSLAADGLDLTYWEHVKGFDSNIQVAVLSKFPIVGRRSHTNESFLLQGRRFKVSRGFGEVDIKVNDDYTFTLFVAHLKSKRASGQADEADLRLEEAKLLREKIEARLTINPKANIVVVGDLNDNKNSPPIRELMGRRGPHKLMDTRPSEGNGKGPSASSVSDSRSETWTYFYAAEDLYSRFDYLLLSPGMAREWVEEQTCVLSLTDWGQASDHRPLVATFKAADL